MNETQLSELKIGLKAGKPSLDLVTELIGAYQAQQLAEEFWSVRAPQLVEEAMILRRIESHARAAAAVLPDTSSALRDLIAIDMKALGECREDHAKEVA